MKDSKVCRFDKHDLISVDNAEEKSNDINVLLKKYYWNTSVDMA